MEILITSILAFGAIIVMERLLEAFYDKRNRFDMVSRRVNVAGKYYFDNPMNFCKWFFGEKKHLEEPITGKIIINSITSGEVEIDIVDKLCKCIELSLHPTQMYDVVNYSDRVVVSNIPLSIVKTTGNCCPEPTSGDVVIHIAPFDMEDNNFNFNIVSNTFNESIIGREFIQYDKLEDNICLLKIK